MTNAGIQRIKITDEVRGAGSWRFKEAEKRHSDVNKIYREIFDQLKCPLNNEVEIVECKRDDIGGIYDRLLGIDIVFNFPNGMSSTAQEKILFEPYNTVTIEYFNDPDRDIKGDWFTLHTAYYFVGYDRKKTNCLQNWIFLDWNAIQRATNQGRIVWKVRSNRRDGAMANFKYIEVWKIPIDCVIAQDWDGEKWINELFKFGIPPKELSKTSLRRLSYYND